MNMSGQWEGKINDRDGFFPFTHVKFEDEIEESPNEQTWKRPILLKDDLFDFNTFGFNAVQLITTEVLRQFIWF